MQKNIIFIILFALVLITGVVISYKYKINNSLSNNTSTSISSSPLAVQTPNTYTSTRYKFKIDYPFNLQLKESSPTAITIGIINDLETNSEVEIKVFEVQLKANATESAEVTAAKSLCKSSMLSTEISCPKVMNEEQLITKSGRRLSSFYLEEKTVSKENGNIINTEQKGPFISSTLSETRNTKTFVLIYPPLDKDPHLVNTQLIHDIANSILIDTE